jgi:hypothetical protein
MKLSCSSKLMGISIGVDTMSLIFKENHYMYHYVHIRHSNYKAGNICAYIYPSTGIYIAIVN